MKDVYEKTNWVDGKTTLNADNFNKIENALEDLYDTSIGVSQLKGVNPISVEIAENQNIEVSIESEGLNKLVKHNVYKSGNGIFLTKEEKKFNLDTANLDDFFPVEKPATIVSIDEDYVNKIVEHPQLESGDGINISIKEDPIIDPTKTEVNENNDEDLDDVYQRPKQPTFVITTDLDYIDENITHPNYIGIKGVKIRKPNIEFVFPEGECCDERTKVAYLDKDYINDKVIDPNVIAEKLNLNPITEYTAGNGILIEEESTEEEKPTEEEEAVEEIIPEGITEEEYETYKDLMTPEDEEPSLEVTKVIKNVKLDEDYLKQFVKDNSPEITSEDGIVVITEEIEDNKVHNIIPDIDKLKELMNITPHSTVSVTEGLTLSVEDPNIVEEQPKEEGEEGVVNLYNPKPINYNISLNIDDVKDMLNYSPHPIIKVEEGIDMTTSEVKDENGETTTVYNFSINKDWINDIVVHKKYRFDGNWFRYSEDPDGVGVISMDKYRLGEYIKSIINKD